MSHVIVLRGPIGAGKTSLMRCLSKLLPNSSVIEVDAIKRMLDPHGSSRWRREASFDIALLMARRALESGRNVITETHSKYPYQQKVFNELAHKIPQNTYMGVLVTAPLHICKLRSQSRHVPGISYTIDSCMVESYYKGLVALPNEIVIDTSKISPEQGAEIIVETIRKSKES